MTYNIATLPERPILNDEQIRQLLDVPKTIANRTPAKGYVDESGHRRCQLDLETNSDEDAQFSVFVRQSSNFIENYSIGLRYRTDDKAVGTITLIRYNGAHGGDSRNPDGHFALPHIHRITAQLLASGNTNPQESHRETTDRYSTFEQALRNFFEDISVTNYAEYFPEALQPRLFDEYQ